MPGFSNLKINARNLYKVLTFPGTQDAVNIAAAAVQREAEAIAPVDSGQYVGSFDRVEHTTTRYPRRATCRVVNRDPMAWVIEFGSYGGGISYEIDGRGPFPGFVDTPVESREKRSTGQRTGIGPAHHTLQRAAASARGTIEYTPAKAR